ncbi:ATP-dependent helicase [Candidatus Woesearchaeota archaeon]|nr:MAG: ATP-dependent helicase [Candidatus Woesearchaeota archaeon]
MVEHKTKPDKEKDILKILHPLVRKWFTSRFEKFALPQLYSVLEIHKRNNILVSAPTGSGKTLTGFLSILNELIDSAEKGILKDKIYAIYVSPLKALNRDISVNLQGPLKEIEDLAGKPLGIRIAVRTSDTSPYEKQKMTKKPPHILITTPESLAIVLNAPKFRELLRGVEWLIIDEVHALAENKRGVHLSLSMERLQRLAGDLCRVGLSATIAPLEDVAQYLVGTNRDCKVVNVQFIKDLDLQVISPVEDLINTPHHIMHHKMYELINKLIQEHKTTLIFTNTRAATERVVDNLKEKFPKNYLALDAGDSSTRIGAHHGSLSKSHRLMIENQLRKGKLKVVVSSTSLELGIDIGYIDLVILLGSPKSVARALQRIGRSGHKLHQKAKGRIIVMDRDDLVECSVLLKAAKEKKIDRIHIPKNCLDVLSQHIYGIAIAEKTNVKDLYKLIKQSYCYQNLSKQDFNDVIDYLAGKYASLEDRHVYAKIWYDEEAGMIGRRGKMARTIYMTNIGTIPDETFVTVKTGNETIGKLDEAFLERLKPGDVFVLGGNTYEFKYSRGMVAQVKASSGRPPTVPRWVSEMLPLSFDLSQEIGKFRRLMEDKLKHNKTKKEILEFIHKYLYVDERAANALYNYFKEQYEYAEIPHDKKILIESYNDGSKWLVFFHSLYGRRVNDCLSRAVAFAASRLYHKDVEIGMNDNGFYLAFGKNLNVLKSFKMLESDNLDMLMDIAIDKSEVLKRRFRHCATRSLMILRSYMGKQKRVGRQQVSSMLLMNAIKRISNDFSILKEARREVLKDLMDIETTKFVLKEIELGKIKIKEIKTDVPSPFAFNLIMQGYADILKIEDKLEFVKRMHNAVMAKISLKKGKHLEHELDDNTKFFRRKIVEFYNESQISHEKEQLIGMLARVNIPNNAKDKLVSIIKGEEDIPDFVLDLVIKHIDEIKKNWPQRLADFVLKKIYEIKQKNFNYDEFWEKSEQKKLLEQEIEKQKIMEDFKKISKKLRIETSIQFDILALIDDPKHRPRYDTIVWLKNLLSGSIPKVWKDNVVKFLLKILKEIDSKID